MFLIPTQQPVRRSTISWQDANDFIPQYTYSDKMTLKEYLQAKNVQRKLQYRALNIARGGSSNPMKEQREYMFEKQVHDIKGFFKHVLGDGSLFAKFEAMLDNLYAMFVKQITVYHKLKLDTEMRIQQNKLKQFRQANNKLTDYLKSCEDESKKVQQRLEHMRQTKEFYQKQRQKRLAQMKKKMEDQKREAERKEKELIQKERTEKQEAERKKKQDQQKRLNSLRNQLFAGKKNQIRPDLRNLQEIQEYKKKKQSIGKLSNVFASVIGGR